MWQVVQAVWVGMKTFWQGDTRNRIENHCTGVTLFCNLNVARKSRAEVKNVNAYDRLYILQSMVFCLTVASATV